MLLAIKLIYENSSIPEMSVKGKGLKHQLKSFDVIYYVLFIESRIKINIKKTFFTRVIKHESNFSSKQ